MSYQTFKEFAEMRFNNDPYAMLAHFAPEISEVASRVGIQWNSVSNLVLNDKKYTGKIETDVKKHKKKVVVFGKEGITQGGVRFPHINFTNHADGGQTETFVGSRALYELFEREKDLGSNPDHDAARKQKLEAEAARREKYLAQKAKEEEEARQKRILEHTKYCDHFFQADQEDGSHPYLVKKQISEIVDHIDLRRMSYQFDKSKQAKGEYTAIRLHDVNNNYRGLQRLYEDSKLYTVAIDSGHFDGAHCVIGDIEAADKVIACEGFATGASIFLAHLESKKNVAIVVAMNADNLKKVVKDYMKKRPDVAEKEWLIAADNDQWKTKAGNKGLLVALEINHAHKIPAVYPLFHETSDGKGPTDFNDLHCLQGLSSVLFQIQQKKKNLIAEKYSFDYSLQRLELVNFQSLKKEVKTAVARGMFMVPSKMSGKEVFNAIAERIHPEADIDRKDILEQIKWQANLKSSAAQASRSFSEKKLNEAHIKYIKLPGVKHESGATLVPPMLVDLVKGLTGAIVIRAPMGSGKTERLMKPIIEEEAGKSAYLAHRVSLIGDVCQRINMLHYKEATQDTIPYFKKIGCCINSIIQERFTDISGQNWFEGVESLCIDEASQTLRHLVQGRAIHNPVKVFDTLVRAMRAATRTVLCDADANDELIGLCEIAYPDQPITVIEIEGKVDNIEVLHTDLNSAYKAIVDAIGRGEKCLVATDAKEQPKKLVETLMSENPEARILYIHQLTIGNENVMQFMDDPNGECQKYDLVMYSPSISSGVSMVVKHFDQHFGLFKGVVTPSDAIQMLRRDRTARRFILGLQALSSKQPTDEEEIFRGMVKADQISLEYFKEGDQIVLRHTPSNFDRAYLKSAVVENKARNDFENNLLLILIAEGYRVSRLATNQTDIDLSKEMQRKAGKLVAKRRLELIESNPTPTDDERDAIMKKPLKSEDDAAKLARWDMANELCATVIDEDMIKFYDQGGLKSVRNFELLLSEEKTAAEYDHAQISSKTVLTRTKHKLAKWRTLRSIFNRLGIDLTTGEGRFDRHMCAAIMDDILKDEDSIALFNQMRIGGQVNKFARPKDPTVFITNILDRMGLKILKHKVRGHIKNSIDPLSWQVMKTFIERRREKGVNSLQTKQDGAPYQASYNTPESAPNPHKTRKKQGGETLRKDDIYTPKQSLPPKESNGMAAAIGFIQNAIEGTSISITQALSILTEYDFHRINRGSATVEYYRGYIAGVLTNQPVTEEKFA